MERLTPDGQTAIYTTLVATELRHLSIGGVAATPAGEAVVVGSTVSNIFPLVNPTQGYPGDGKFQLQQRIRVQAGAEWTVRLLDVSGWSAGRRGPRRKRDRHRHDCRGRHTESQDFPGVDGLQTARRNGFVTVFSSAGARLHGAILPAAIAALDVDPLGAVYVAGDTRGTDWPTTPEAFQPTPYAPSAATMERNAARVCWPRSAPNLGSLVYSTYLHTTGHEQWEVDVHVTALDVDASGAAYILWKSLSRIALHG